MKHTYLTTVIGLMMTLGAHADPPKTTLSAEGWYKRGLAAVKDGKPDDAKTAFQNALKLNPRFTPAKHQLSLIPELNARTKIARRKKLFKDTIIKEINFRDATLKEALEALDKMAAKASKDKFSPNFIIQDPAKKIVDRKVKLKMTNVPLAAALSYILQGVGATARYDEYATPIKPLGK